MNGDVCFGKNYRHTGKGDLPGNANSKIDNK